MLYRPNFCANCGERIERGEWGWLTSRRFCPLCETEYKGHDLIPRLIVGAGVLLGVLGLGSYLSSGPSGEATLVRQPRKVTEQTVASIPVRPLQTDPKRDVTGANAISGQPEGNYSLQTTLPSVNARPDFKSLSSSNGPAEQMYYCGAETKKGTPCSRRVKGNVRCYQHIGMPAIVVADKLKVN